MSLAVLKFIHIGAAVISICGFLLRAVLAIRSSPSLKHPLLRFTPHIVDTVLLASAIALMFGIHQYPLVDSWLTAKLFALLVYIALGFFVLRFGRSSGQRLVTALAAVLVFAYIAAVAMSHDPLLGLRP